MEVRTCSEHVAEVAVKGSNSFKCVVNLQDRTCSCRKFQVSGIPCLHAIAFITKMGESLECYVDSYYSVEKFRVAYENLIPALTSKAQWQQLNHGFFMHPPLLKSTAGRRKNQRCKGCTEGGTTQKKGQHRCPICQSFRRHRNTCKNGDPNDIAALLAERGPPKKKKKKTNETAQESTSIVPVPSGPTPMYFPPSQGGSTNISSGKTEKSACGSNQPDPLSINLPSSFETPPLAATQPVGKRKREGKAKEKAQGKAKPNKNKRTVATQKQPLVPVPPQSPAMCTIRKNPESPAMSTRSKRRILN